MTFWRILLAVLVSLNMTRLHAVPLNMIKNIILLHSRNLAVIYRYACFFFSGNSITSKLQSSITILSGCPPASPHDQLQPTQPDSTDESGRSSPLCSSILLELPPSPAHALPLASNPAPPPLSLCTTPPLSAPSRKRRSDVPAFDAADWLESLTSGLHTLTPPTAPFVESDFALDSDLNISRVLDLMVEQW